MCFYVEQYVLKLVRVHSEVRTFFFILLVVAIYISHPENRSANFQGHGRDNRVEEISAERIEGVKWKAAVNQQSCPRSSSHRFLA